jgi:transcriptional regulator with XRE-family HTH domain
MQTASDSSVTLGGMLAAARAKGGVGVEAGLSVRELGRRAGVSAAQLSRIESGQVARPSREILVALARALNRNPLPLLILAGHLEADEAQAALAVLFRAGAELPDEWGSAHHRYDLALVRRIVTQSETPALEKLRIIAAEVFAVEETDETLWDDSYLLAMTRGEHAAEDRELMEIWRYIGERRQQLLEYGRSLRDLVDLEFRVAADIQDSEAQVTSTRRKKGA